VFVHLRLNFGRRRCQHRSQSREVVDVDADGDVVASVVRDVVDHIAAELFAIGFALSTSRGRSYGIRLAASRALRTRRLRSDSCDQLTADLGSDSRRSVSFKEMFFASSSVKPLIELSITKETTRPRRK
jgi:hypothetical protein